MFLQDRKKCFVQLGDRLRSLSPDELNELCLAALNQNSWFTEKSVKEAISGISLFLTSEELDRWTASYDFEHVNPKLIGVIAAGNIPLVGFHDVLTVLIAGHRLLLKPSSDDSILMAFIRSELIKIDSDFDEKFIIADRLNDADAFIATGSDNSARYFKYYFKDKPNIIRANRTSVAILTGDESTEEVAELGNDIFQYYGLGCRNVSKIFVPTGFDFTHFLDGLHQFENVQNHHKFTNNYDYNKSIYLVNREEHLDTGFLLLRESIELVSPISVLYYEYYQSDEELKQLLERFKEKIQCVVGKNYLPFGSAQCPSVSDYADGVDTLAFLLNL